MKRLSELTTGKSAKIISFKDEGLSLKLLEMGVLPEENICILKRAPLGGPISIEVAGYTICLRKKDAANVMVEELSPNNNQCLHQD